MGSFVLVTFKVDELPRQSVVDVALAVMAGAGVTVAITADLGDEQANCPVNTICGLP